MRRSRWSRRSCPRSPPSAGGAFCGEPSVSDIGGRGDLPVACGVLPGFSPVPAIGDVPLPIAYAVCGLTLATLIVFGRRWPTYRLFVFVLLRRPDRDGQAVARAMVNYERNDH